MRKYHGHTLLYLHETIALGAGTSDRFTLQGRALRRAFYEA